MSTGWEPRAPFAEPLHAAIWLVRTAAEADMLAAHLLHPARTRPCVVVSVPADAGLPTIDAQAIRADVGDLSDVIVIVTGPATRALAQALPPSTQVYGSVGRAYPVGVAWTQDPSLSPLRFARDAQGAAWAGARLVEDALAMVACARATVRPAAVRAVRAEVAQVVPPARAILRTDAGLASVRQEDAFPDLALDRVLTPGMAVTGVLDPVAMRVELDVPVDHTREQLDRYVVGAVVLARVRSAGPDGAALELHPGLPVDVAREAVTGNPADGVDGLLAPGQVVAARVQARPDGPWPPACGDGAGWQLGLLDIDDDESPLPAVALLPGGPPWLRDSDITAGRGSGPGTPTLPVPTVPAPIVAVREPAEAAGGEVLRLRAQLAERADDLDRARAEARRLRRGEAALQDRLRQVTRDRDDLLARLARRDDRPTSPATSPRRADRTQRSQRRGLQADRGPLFADPEEQFRFEVQVAWAERIPAADKAGLPLARYVLGPRFLASLDQVQGIDRGKVVAVVVEVLTGLADRLHGRDLHQLRTERGGAPVVVREDGATCWRVSLQAGTPGGRRLHFWRSAAAIELSRVVLHDDMNP